ncbi:alkaline phosphatase D family protein, partial [Microbispora triticiradicis]|uniref:alkaline phosphatase D family protein n=1 Tax=Microbispora triticiradicis TaxID=2200763 RepID=UPI001AD7516F
MARVATLGDGATNGATVTSANSGLTAGLPFDSLTIGSGATLTWDTAHGGYRGSAAMKVTTPASAVNSFARWDNMFRPTPGVLQVATAWMYFTANPAATTSVLFVGNTTAQRICEMRVSTAGRVRAYNSAGTQILETTNAIALNQWVRADLLYTPHASAGTLQLKLYNNPNSSTPTETTTQATAQNLRQTDPFLFLVGVSNGATNITYWVQAAFTDGNPVPFGTGFVVSRWVGAVTNTSAAVAARVLGASSVRLKVSTSSDLLTSPVFSSAQAPDADGTVRMSVTGLSADTAYYYGIEVDGAVDTDFNGTFRTAPTPGAQASFVFAAGSCARNNSDAATFDAIRAETPAFMVHLGDLHYRDIITNDQAAVHRAYDQVMSSPKQLAFFGNLPVPYIWSDHDSVGPNGDSTSAALPASNAVLRSRVPGYSNRPATTGCYFSFTWGRIKVICTDGRSFRSAIAATDDASKTMLGSVQKAWLKTELADPDYPVKIWAHENAISNGATFTGDDTWSAYATERQELVDYIRTNGIRVAYICGDLHVLAADDGTNVPTAAASPPGFPVHVCSPLDQSAYLGNGTYSGGKYPLADSTPPNYYTQYGKFTVTDSGSSISLAYSGKDAGGTTRITQITTWTVSTPQDATPAGAAGAVRVRASAGGVQAVQRAPLPAGAGVVRVAPSAGAVLAVREAPAAGAAGSLRVRASPGTVLAAEQARPVGAAGAVRLRASSGAVSGG